MLLEERIETTSFPKTFGLQVTFGLDTAGEHCLLDQRIPFETNFQAARNLSVISSYITDKFYQSGECRCNPCFYPFPAEQKSAICDSGGYNFSKFAEGLC